MKGKMISITYGEGLLWVLTDAGELWTYTSGGDIWQRIK